MVNIGPTLPPAATPKPKGPAKAGIQVSKPEAQPVVRPVVERRKNRDRRQTRKGKPVLLDLRSGRDRRRNPAGGPPASIDVSA